MTMRIPEQTTPDRHIKEILTRRRSSSLDLDMSESSSSSSSSSSSGAATDAATKFRSRSSSLDVTSLAKTKSSSNFLQFFVRRSSTDFSIGDTLSPAASFESIPSCDDSQPRSRHRSGDASSQPANQIGGLVSAQTGQQQHPLVRQKSESSLWNWKLFPPKADDGSRIRRISEMDESDAAGSKTKMTDLSTPGGATSHSSSGLLNFKMATRISARDLNALSPSGDI